MTTDPLSPEDRALHDAFFAAARVKFNELGVAAGGGEVSIDACMVHAIKAMVDREIERRYLEMIPPIEAPRIVSAVGVGVRVKPPEGEQ